MFSAQLGAGAILLLKCRIGTWYLYQSNAVPVPCQCVVVGRTGSGPYELCTDTEVGYCYWTGLVPDLPVGSPACAVPNGPVVVNILTLGMSLPHGIPFRRPIPHERAYVAMAISGVPACRERPSQACANEHNDKQAKDLSQVPSPHV
uniref:Uncharacterized protein n=1 Tax=Ananas comosus var. bracteatus TaxID=296719 RepID=A0A6V7NIM6_ANACO|nr:unnamed protein product [Ananas comosus var. bracteatus]